MRARDGLLAPSAKSRAAQGRGCRSCRDPNHCRAARMAETCSDFPFPFLSRVFGELVEQRSLMREDICSRKVQTHWHTKARRAMQWQLEPVFRDLCGVATRVQSGKTRVLRQMNVTK